MQSDYFFITDFFNKNFYIYIMILVLFLLSIFSKMGIFNTLNLLIDYYTSLPFIFFIYIQLINLIPTVIAFSTLILPFNIFFSNYNITEIFEEISSLSILIGYIGGLGQDNFKTFMAYSSISMSSILFFLLLINEDHEYENFIYYFIIYLLCCLILYIIIIIYEKKNKLFINSNNNNFPKGNYYYYLSKFNKNHTKIFLFFLFLINATPPFISFGGKLITIIDIYSEFNIISTFILLLFSFLGFIFYFNIFFIKIKYIKNSYKNKDNFIFIKLPFILYFLIFIFFIHIIIYDLNNLLLV